MIFARFLIRFCVLLHPCAFEFEYEHETCLHTSIKGIKELLEFRFSIRIKRKFKLRRKIYLTICTL